MSPQTEVLYEHMKKYGIFRAASRIHEMRKAGIPVDSTLKTGKNRYGIDVRYAEYRLGANA